MTYKGRALVKPPKIHGQPVKALLPLLKAPEDRTRYAVRRELAQHDSKEVVAALDTWVASMDAAAAAGNPQNLAPPLAALDLSVRKTSRTGS